MYQSSFCYTASYDSTYVPQLCPAPEIDPREASTPAMLFGIPMPSPVQFYSSFPPNYYQMPAPMPISMSDPTQLPIQPNSIQDLNFSATSYYSSELGNVSGFSQSSRNDSWLEYSQSSIHSGEDVTSEFNDSSGSVEVSKRFAGTFAPSYRGASPVLLYRIPSTDLCYVYNRIRTVDGLKGHYVCRECYLKKKYVPAKVANQRYFTTDPLTAGHICRPKNYAKEMTSRQSAKKRTRGQHNDSGLSNSFPDIS
ncbi:hypothetical protein RB195_021165 [Necator americanus]|uniref:GATA-type domain-containing protein n=1 Tax=Necator americanus TaxID=51031 RepID=A0ABR1E9V4_NECAM